MVLKKTNVPAVNSGNTMKKRCYRQTLQKTRMKATHVIKQLFNISPTEPTDGRYWEIDAAEEYIDDGGLRHCAPFTHCFSETYSLNKKRRWLLDDILRNTVHNTHLAREQFKITMVHRVVPGHQITTHANRTRNVTHYYDSHTTSKVVEADGRCGTRLGFLQKASTEPKPHEEPKPREKPALKTRKHPYHNQHFRDLQRKMPKRGKRSRERRHWDVDRETFPEIRYEIAEPDALNSLNLRSWETPQYYYRGWSRKPQGWRYFRGFKRDRVERYFSDYKIPMPPCKGNQRGYVAESVLGDASLWKGEEEEDDEETEWTPPPLHHHYSLWELLEATQQQRHRQWPKTTTSPHHTTPPINPATGKTVKKHGKGTAIFAPQQQTADTQNLENVRDIATTPPNNDDDDEVDTTIVDIDNDSSLVQNDAGVLANFKDELDQFDGSFVSCGLPEREVEVSHLHEVFEGAVEFASCLPVVVKFDLGAVWQLHQRGREEGEEEGEDLEGWGLLCQLGNSPLGQGRGTQAKKAWVRVVGSHEKSVVIAANRELKRQLTCGSVPLLVLMSVDSLLIKACEVVRQFVLKRLRRVFSVSVSSRVDTASGRPLTGLPHQHYTGQVEICTVQQAFDHLRSALPPPPQPTSLVQDLGVVSSMIWVGLKCTVCFTYYGKEETTEHGFSVFVVMAACGHSFCRQCWQHHLVSSIMEGKTTVYCMRYKCETTVDAVMLMSLVPQAVYDRWRRRLRVKMVESSGQWTWCPNARCGHLARLLTAEQDRRRGGDKRGVPVSCRCQRQWCLDCQQDVHWPITCLQFTSYRNMLRQNGEEDGMKTNYVEITSVRVKRCPACRYPIEKNGGCSHMVCSQCHEGFCWVCLASWKTHVYGNWTGCYDKPEETVELENKRVYPLPVECYKKAVSHRYIWKLLQSERRRVVATFVSYCFITNNREKNGETYLQEDLVKHVVNAYRFLKKGHMMLELSFILLSNAPRRHPLSQPLHNALHLLDFLCQRVAQYVRQPVKQVLRMGEGLHTVTQCGDRQLRHVCFLAHCLVSTVTGASTQQWLLQGDHERFVSFK